MVTETRHHRHSVVGSFPTSACHIIFYFFLHLIRILSSYISVLILCISQNGLIHTGLKEAPRPNAQGVFMIAHQHTLNDSASRAGAVTLPERRARNNIKPPLNLRLDCNFRKSSNGV